MNLIGKSFMKKLLNKRCLLDTNVLVSFIDKKHQYHKKASEIFEQILAGNIETFISSQNILELTAVFIHGYKKPKREVAENIELLMSDKLIALIYPSTKSLIRFLELMKKNTEIHTVDLFLISTALENDIDIIISGDKNLQKIKEIAVFNPFS